MTDENLNRPVEANDSNIRPEAPKQTIVQPSLWKPVEVWEGNDGEVTTKATTKRITDWDDILITLGYPVEEFEIVEPVKVSTWEVTGKDGATEQLWSYKAGIRRRTTPRDIPYDDLTREIKAHRPKKQKVEASAESTFVINVADTQFAKADGDGLEGTIKRFLSCIDGVENRIVELNKAGRGPQRILVAGLGDIIEGCSGNYNAQQFTVEANLREQLRIARRLIRDLIIRVSPYAPEVWVTAVPGNHGEERQNGRLYTDVGDNHDVGVFETLADIFAANPSTYGHVKFYLPENEIYTMFDLHGTVVGFTHGHITKGGGNAQTKIRGWWQDQSFGDQAIGQAKVLFTGHYHHTSVIQYGKKCHIQCPSLDGGSTWWQNLSGDESPPGMLTCTITADGWDDIKVIL